jgi:uncharacterized protein (TIGR00730 family)
VKVAVFCSANPNLDPKFIAAAKDFGQGLARRKWELIYGGAQVGLMGTFADACLAGGGVARGAITEGLAKGPEVAHARLQELVIVKDLFERKRWMNDEADVFTIFPGGLGTLDEALEVITWKSLGLHEKPIVFVNLEGFWQSQLEVFRELSRKGVIRRGGLDLYTVTDTVEGLWSILDGVAKSSLR